MNQVSYLSQIANRVSSRSDRSSGNQLMLNPPRLLFRQGEDNQTVGWGDETPLSDQAVDSPLSQPPTADVFTLQPAPSQAKAVTKEAIANPGAIRSNATPFSIAALVDPNGGTVLTPAGNIYTLNGQGFNPGTVEVLLETVALTSEQFTVNNSTEITFQLPDNLPNGVYGVRVRVNQVESHPAKWVVKS